MIMLYRAGDTHTIRGKRCEAKRFENRQLQACLDAGWRASPEQVPELAENLAPAPEKPAKPKQAPSKVKARATAKKPTKPRGRPRKATGNGE